MAWVHVGPHKINTALVCYVEQEGETVRVYFAGEAVHETADGRSLLVTHGDQFDTIIRCARGLALLGDHAYDFSLVLNDGFNAVRRRFGLP